MRIGHSSIAHAIATQFSIECETLVAILYTLRLECLVLGDWPTTNCATMDFQPKNLPLKVQCDTLSIFKSMRVYYT